MPLRLPVLARVVLAPSYPRSLLFCNCASGLQPDIDEDKGEYRSEEPIETPELPTRWVGGTTGVEYPSMVVYVRGAVPFAAS